MEIIFWRKKFFGTFFFRFARFEFFWCGYFFDWALRTHQKDEKFFFWGKTFWKKINCFFLKIGSLLTLLVLFLFCSWTSNIQEIAKIFCRGNFFGKNSGYFSLKSVWYWHNLLFYSLNLHVFKTSYVICFWIDFLESEENQEKYFKRKFSQSAFLEFCFVFLSIRAFSTLLVMIIFWLGA